MPYARCRRDTFVACSSIPKRLRHFGHSIRADGCSEDEAIDLLDDLLVATRAANDEAGGARSARDYLIEWASDTRGFVRRYYPIGDDTAQIAATPATERAVTWLSSLEQSAFPGTDPDAEKR